MKSFALGKLVFMHYTDGDKHTKARNELWAACAACGRSERVAKGVDSDALAQFLADDYAYGLYRHDCYEEPW